MKKTILLTLTLIISYASIGQFWLKEHKSKSIGIKDSGIVIDNFSWLQINPINESNPIKNYYQITINGILKVSGNKDTLEIQSKDIKYIKVDGKVYEIKRNTELKEVDTNIGYFNGLRNVTPYIITTPNKQ